MPAYDPKTLAKLPPPAKKVVYSDPDVAGLKLIHRPKGSKTFVWRAMWGGVQRDITFGSYPGVSIYAARTESRKLNELRACGATYDEYASRPNKVGRAANTNVADVAVDGAGDLAGLPRVSVHPRGAVIPAADLASVPDGKTCDWMFDLYMEKEGNSRDSAREKRRMYDRDLKDVIGHMSIFEVTYDDFADILSKKAQTAPIQSNNLQSLIRRWWKWACTLGRSETGMRSQINPTVDLVKLSKPRSKDRFLSEYEIALFLRALQIKPTVMNEGWRLVLLTGVRRDEAFSARFSEFDLEKGEWHIPKERTKTDEELMLPLPPQAVAVVRRAVAEMKEGQTLLWPSRGTHMSKRGPDATEQPRSGFSKATNIIHATMEVIAAADPQRPTNFDLKPWSTHDLRRTLASGMNGLMDEDYNPMISSELVERILNHKIGGVKGVYNRHAYYREKKAALALWADHLDKIESKFIDRLSCYRAKA